MSNVSSIHDVVPFVAGKTEALTGQRLAKVGYKSTKNTPAKFPNVAVSVPHINSEDITGNINALLPYIGNMLESAQDGIIRGLYEGENGKLKTVSDADISVQACISYLEAEAAGDRLRKEHIEAWFDRVCADNVFTLIAEKFGYGDDLTPEQVETVNKHVKTYRDILSMLAGGNVKLTPVQIKGCRTAVELSADSGGIGTRLLARLNNLEKPAPVSDFVDISA